ncbi:MAG: hypothetical protein RBS73_01770 [Prolixibacteraceae bacterium]|jgi:hypothetical protein|nr:hypothetical protein [Prolixibacteraceae bacterium]
MKEMSFERMEEVNGGGCSKETEQVIATIGFIASVASAFGPIGLAIAGPTALGMGIGSLVCAFR